MSAMRTHRQKSKPDMDDQQLSDLRAIARADQEDTALRVFAQTANAYYNARLDAGFEVFQAVVLLRDWHLAALQQHWDKRGGL